MKKDEATKVGRATGWREEWSGRSRAAKVFTEVQVKNVASLLLAQAAAISVRSRFGNGRSALLSVRKELRTPNVRPDPGLVIPALRALHCNFNHNTSITMSEQSLEQLLADTLSLLEWRLRRLEFVLDGSVDRNLESDQQPRSPASPPVLSRVQKLEQSMQQLATKSEVARELFKWRMLYLHCSQIRCRLTRDQIPYFPICSFQSRSTTNLPSQIQHKSSQWSSLKHQRTLRSLRSSDTSMICPFQPQTPLPSWSRSNHAWPSCNNDNARKPWKYQAYAGGAACCCSNGTSCSSWAKAAAGLIGTRDS
jgi:hypothetical protein